MYRLRVLVLCAVLVTVVAGPEAGAEGGYGLRYGQRQREGRREAADNQGFTPSQEDEESQQQENGPEASSTSRHHQRHHQQVSSQGQEDPSEDSDTGASSYRTVVLHGNQEHQRYPNPRKKPTKPRQKVNRQIHRETSINYKTLKNTKLADPPPQVSNILHVTTPGPGDQLEHAVHPSIMQNLLKQQPQTFDVPQEKEPHNYDQQNNWQNQDEAHNSNNQGLNSFHSNYDSQGDLVGQQENSAKRPIYVPNRVSVHSPSSDTAFNVGYSIGFGTGLSQPPRMGVVQPPVNLRHGKQLSIPSSYQNTPVNVHIDGKKTVWKNMGSGVEMSHNIDSQFESPNPIGSSDNGDRHVYSSDSVINQPIFFREGFDQSFNSISTSGRNNFDHNHALQQSNSFDFSNAIDPMTNHPYSAELKTNPFISHVQPSFAESFSKHPMTSFTESLDKHPHSSYSETFPKQTKASFTRGHQAPRIESPQYLHTVLSANDNPVSIEGKYERQKHEKPIHHTGLQGAVRVPNSVNLITQPKTNDFLKSNPGGAKSSYSFKTFSNTGLNSINDDMLVNNNYVFQNTPALQHMYGSGQAVPSGMVQAFLVPVNSQTPPLPYPVGMQLLGNGYSPYFGHPVGMVRIPDPTGGNVPQKEEFESMSYNGLENKHQQGYLKTPVKLFQTHFTTRHQTEEAQDPQHQLTRPNSHPRVGDGLERSPKFNRGYSTETPDHTAFVKSHSPSSLHSNFESTFEDPSSVKGSPQYSSLKEHSPSYSSLKETSPAHHPISHHPRPYRTKKLVIVKRS